MRWGSSEASTSSRSGSSLEPELSCGRGGTVMDELAVVHVEVEELVEGRMVRKEATELLRSGTVSGPNATRSSGRATSRGVNLQGTIRQHSAGSIRR